MGYLPIFVNLEGRDCLVIGGGELAERRVKALREAGAAVTVTALEITPALAAMVEAGTIRWIARDYKASDMRGRFMAWVATTDEAFCRSAASDARELGIMINVTDRPALCDFITPAVVKRGEVQIAIATGGASPALARRLREQLEEVVGPEYGRVAELLRSARRWLSGHVDDPSERARILSKLVASGVIEAFAHDDLGEVQKIVRALLGTGLNELDSASENASLSMTEAVSASRIGHA